MLRELRLGYDEVALLEMNISRGLKSTYSGRRLPAGYPPRILRSQKKAAVLTSTGCVPINTLRRPLQLRILDTIAPLRRCLPGTHYRNRANFLEETLMRYSLAL